jgi:hypothetical protein
MDYKVLARRIPNNVRSQKLFTADDPIATAIPISINYQMQVLFNIWFTFIEPEGEKKLNCPICLQTILDNFRQMHGVLIELERESKILNEI